MAEDQSAPTGDGKPTSDEQKATEEAAKHLRELEAKIQALQEQNQASQADRDAAVRKMHEATQARAEIERKLNAQKKVELTDKDRERFRDDPSELADYAARIAAERSDATREEILAEMRKGFQQMAEAVVTMDKEYKQNFQSMDPRTQSDAFKRYKAADPSLSNEQIFNLLSIDTPPGAPQGTGKVPSKHQPDDNEEAFQSVFGGRLAELDAILNKGGK